MKQSLSAEELAQYSEKYCSLLLSQHTLLLATASTQGQPDNSYAPYVRDDTGNFYIFISELSKHTLNLRENPYASILFIRPEQDSPNLFARERAMLDCKALDIAREQASYSTVLHDLQQQFGEVISLLNSLNDFHLFQLQPTMGRFVMGFGKAFNIDLANNRLLPQ